MRKSPPLTKSELGGGRLASSLSSPFEDDVIFAGLASLGLRLTFDSGGVLEVDTTLCFRIVPPFSTEIDACFDGCSTREGAAAPSLLVVPNFSAKEGACST